MVGGAPPGTGMNDGVKTGALATAVTWAWPLGGGAAADSRVLVGGGAVGAWLALYWKWRGLFAPPALPRLDVIGTGGS